MNAIVSGRLVVVTAMLASLMMLSGCFRYASNPSYPDGGYQFVHKDLANADRLVAAAKTAGKDAECPDEYNAIKNQMKKAYDTYKACRTDEAIALAKDAADKAGALCPPKPAPPAPEAKPQPRLVPPAPKQIVLEDVHFPHNKATLTPEATAILDRNAIVLKDNLSVKVRVAGYTSLSGTDAYNKKLSHKRADAVRNYLIKTCGIPADRIEEVWFGEENPAMSEPNPKEIETEAAKANRRVVFIIISQ